MRHSTKNYDPLTLIFGKAIDRPVQMYLSEIQIAITATTSAMTN